MARMLMGKCSKIGHIVRLRQMLRRWRDKARMSSSASTGIPHDVPSGHVAVCVGPSSRRFIIRATHLNHPLLKKLLAVEEEENRGFISNYKGPLAIPSCDESLFEQLVCYVSKCSDSGSITTFVNLEEFRRNCHVGASHLLVDSRPLLHGYDNTPLW